MLGDILFGPLEAAMDILIDLSSMWQSHFFGPLSPGITFFLGGGADFSVQQMPGWPPYRSHDVFFDTLDARRGHPTGKVTHRDGHHRPAITISLVGVG